MSTIKRNGQAHAVVVDVATTWEDYRLVRRALAGATARGLLFHVAGPTEDGVRTIGIWDSDGAWGPYQELIRTAYGELSMAPVVRELSVVDLISGQRTR